MPAATRRQRRRGGRTVTVPERGHPLVRLLFREMRAQGLDYAALERVSGVAGRTVMSWRGRGFPNLPNLEACLNALGFDLTAQRRTEAPRTPRSRLATPPVLQRLAALWRQGETLAQIQATLEAEFGRRFSRSRLSIWARQQGGRPRQAYFGRKGRAPLARDAIT